MGFRFYCRLVWRLWIACVAGLRGMKQDLLLDEIRVDCGIRV